MNRKTGGKKTVSRRCGSSPQCRRLKFAGHVFGVRSPVYLLVTFLLSPFPSLPLESVRRSIPISRAVPAAAAAAKRKKFVPEKRAQVTLSPSTILVSSPPEAVKLDSAADRFQYIMRVLVSDLELPVERDDLLTVPDRNPLPFASEDVRCFMYNYILFGDGDPVKVLGIWIGKKDLQSLRIDMLLHKISESGMEPMDFSKMARSMLPIKDPGRGSAASTQVMGRGDVETITVIMREIGIFRSERKREKESGLMSVRKAHIETANAALVPFGLCVDDLPWSGPEPTRMTLNQMIEGVECLPASHVVGTEEVMHEGRSPQLSRDRWEMGLRRLELNHLLKERDLDIAKLMLDEKLYNRIAVFVEMGLSTALDVVNSIEEMEQLGQSQWSRPKKRTSRWAFNFPPDLSEGEEKERHVTEKKGKVPVVIVVDEVSPTSKPRNQTRKSHSRRLRGEKK